MSNDQGEPARGNRPAATSLETVVRLGALALLLYWSLILLEPFLTITVWSVVVTISLYPLFEWLSLRLGKRPRLAAALITLMNLLIVIGPATWIGVALIESIKTISGQLDLSTTSLPPPSETVRQWPLIGDQLYDFWTLASTNLKAALAEIAPQLKPLGGSLLGIAAGTGTGILKFFVAIFIAGFLFSPAPKLIRTANMFVRRLAPERGEEFVALAVATIRTVARGVIGVSVLQALLAGAGLIAAGVPGYSLITSLVLIFGIIQIGPSVVLVPVIVWSWFSMGTAAAILFTAYMVPVTLLDNVLRPLVMGRGLKTPILVILIGVIGGTLAYGISGLFLGPLVLAVMWELLAAWIREGEADAG